MYKRNKVGPEDCQEDNQVTHTRTFNGPFSGSTQVSRYQKGKPIWILLEQETVSGSGISWAICKSAPCSRQITMPVPHHSKFFTGRMPFLPPNQQRQSTEGKRQSSQYCEMSDVKKIVQTSVVFVKFSLIIAVPVKSAVN